MKHFSFRHAFFWVVAQLALMTPVLAQNTSIPTTITREDLDVAAYAQWLDGAEKPVKCDGSEAGPIAAVWTKETIPRHNGISSFGAGAKLGPRHLRIGFAKPITVGTIITAGNCNVSVLKSAVKYPGDLSDDKLWTRAERIAGDKTSTEGSGYIVWTLPVNTTTRAIRFTHEPKATDKTYDGVLGGVVVLESRFVNLAPQARVFTSVNEANAPLLNDEHTNYWGTWDNWDDAMPPKPVAEQSPWAMLVWPAKVDVSGLAVLFSGFGSADVQSFSGKPDANPRLAPDSDWKTIKSFDHIANWYPIQLPIQWLDFGKTVSTQAIRIRMTSSAPEGHPHIVGKTKEGRRVWLDEVMAFKPMFGKPLASALPAPVVKQETHPPIPIRFTLKDAGFVTLVIDDAAGHRVRNLVSQTPFPKGENTAWWDGLDDTGRDVDAARHGLYRVPGAFVAPGQYNVRGLFLKGVDLTYEFPIYTAGNPAWYTADHTGGWLSNHTPPSATQFVPASRTPSHKDLVFIGSHVSEGTDGLAWVDMDGHKVGGMHWVGGLWTGAQALAFDAGDKANVDHVVYVGALFQGELRLTAILANGEKSLFKTTYPKDTIKDDLGGIAVRNGEIVASLPRLNKLVFVDAASGKQTREVEVVSPRGVAFDRDGKLLVVSGRQVLRYENDKPSVLIAKDLESPQQITLDSAGLIYVSDYGASHQVKVFTSAGAPVRSVGKPGAPSAGAYDPMHMNHPTGVTVDAAGRLWVAEKDEQPKRISVWSADGQLVNAMYGPAEYGGGGTLDHTDKTLFYYKGMTFKLDWKAGTNKLINVYWRPDDSGSEKIEDTGRKGAPQMPHYVDGRKYFSNTYNSSPTNGASLVTIWIEKNGLVRPVACLGRANDWGMLKEEAFKPLWPTGVDLAGDYWKNQAFCMWCDLNDNGVPDADEIKIIKGVAGGVTIMPDLSAVVSRVDGNTLRFAPTKFTASGAPVFDIAGGKVLARDVQGPASSGGDQALASPDGWTVLSAIPKPYDQHSLAGVFNGEPRWSYPDMWPGLHASHEAQVPDQPGMIIGTTRLAGGFITPKGSDAGPLFCINGNMGCLYLFTEDGLFVSQLFRESRIGAAWAMPVAQRGMNLNEVTLHDENFWPSITQTSDGEVYLVDGGRTSLVRVGGLDTLHRLPDSTVKVTVENLVQAREYFNTAEAARQADAGVLPMRVGKLGTASVDGKLDEWNAANWVTIDKRGTRANFDSHSVPYDVRAAAGVSGDRLYLAYRTGDAKLLENSGETPLAFFKDGGALDFMLAADPAADAKRKGPAAGDVRLLVTQVKGKTAALLYRAVVPGTAESDRVPFSSPWRTVKFDRVEDVSEQVKLAGADGDFEVSVPLATLGWKPQAGQKYRGDIGILRGDHFHTMQRVYWSNKATTTTADVPSEAELTPLLWGELDVD